MVSYVPNKNKPVVLLSSMQHHESIISNEHHRKPEIILLQGGIGRVIDQMVRHWGYCCNGAPSGQFLKNASGPADDNWHSSSMLRRHF